MKRYLFLEIYKESILLYINTDTDKLDPLDLSGGYGTLDIGLSLLVLEDESFIGQDGLQFDLDESSVYIPNVLKDEAKYLNVYMMTLLDKVKDYSPFKQIDEMIFIHDQNLGIECFRSEYPDDFENIPLKYVTIDEAMAGYGCVTDHWTYLVDEDRIRTYIIEKNPDEMGRIRCHLKSLEYPLDILSLDKKYIDLLANQHKIDLSDESENISPNLIHSLRRLYLSQRNAFRKLHIGEDKIQIYSSILFPPMKLEIDKKTIEAIFHDYESDLIKWLDGYYEMRNKEYSSHWKLCLTGRWERLCWVMPDKDFVNIQGTNGLLSEGALYYLKEKESGNDILEASYLGYSIGIIREEYLPLVFKDTPYHQGVSLDLMVGDELKVLSLYKEKAGHVSKILTLDIDKERESVFFGKLSYGFRRLKIKLTFNKNKEVKEVYHEFGKL